MKTRVLRICMLLGLALAGAHVHAGTVVEGVRIWRAPDHSRLVFDLSSRASYSVSALTNPDRVAIDLDDSRVKSSLQSIDLTNSPVERIRSGMRDPRTLRIVLDVRAALQAKSFLLGPSGEYGERLVVDLYGWTPPQTASASQAEPPPAIETPTAEAPSDASELVIAPQPLAMQLAQDLPGKGRDILIAIDAGHGGEDPGAIGPRRVMEKNVVLAIARELERRVNNTRGFRATMIRKGDYYVGLKQRRDLARQRGADLFVSIHADAFTHARARGGSVYALSPRGATSTSAAFLAQRENGADLIGGVNLGEKDDVLASVLTDLSMTATMDASLSAGDRVLNSMGRVAHLHQRRVEQAGFMVLKSPDLPSILVETGFISNPSEAERLNSRAYQRTMASAIFSGLSDYFVTRPPPDTLLAVNGSADFRPSEYVISRGDTLSGIAQRYRVSVSEIVRTNQLGGGNDIRAGQKIVIPQI